MYKTINSFLIIILISLMPACSWSSFFGFGSDDNLPKKTSEEMLQELQQKAIKAQADAKQAETKAEQAAIEAEKAKQKEILARQKVKQAKTKAKKVEAEQLLIEAEKNAKQKKISAMYAKKVEITSKEQVKQAEILVQQIEIKIKTEKTEQEIKEIKEKIEKAKKEAAVKYKEAIEAKIKAKEAEEKSQKESTEAVITARNQAQKVAQDKENEALNAKKEVEEVSKPLEELIQKIEMAKDKIQEVMEAKAKTKEAEIEAKEAEIEVEKTKLKLEIAEKEAEVAKLISKGETQKAEEMIKQIEKIAKESQREKITIEKQKIKQQYKNELKNKLLSSDTFSSLIKQQQYCEFNDEDCCIISKQYEKNNFKTIYSRGYDNFYYHDYLEDMQLIKNQIATLEAEKEECEDNICKQEKEKAIKGKNEELKNIKINSINNTMEEEIFSEIKADLVTLVTPPIETSINKQYKNNKDRIDSIKATLKNKVFEYGELLTLNTEEIKNHIKEFQGIDCKGDNDCLNAVIIEQEILKIGNGDKFDTIKEIATLEVEKEACKDDKCKQEKEKAIKGKNEELNNHVYYFDYYKIQPIKNQIATLEAEKEACKDDKCKQEKEKAIKGKNKELNNQMYLRHQIDLTYNIAEIKSQIATLEAEKEKCEDDIICKQEKENTILDKIKALNDKEKKNKIQSVIKQYAELKEKTGLINNIRETVLEIETLKKGKEECEDNICKQEKENTILDKINKLKNTNIEKKELALKMDKQIANFAFSKNDEKGIDKIEIFINPINHEQCISIVKKDELIINSDGTKRYNTDRIKYINNHKLSTRIEIPNKSTKSLYTCCGNYCIEQSRIELTEIKEKEEKGQEKKYDLKSYYNVNKQYNNEAKLNELSEKYTKKKKEFNEYKQKISERIDQIEKMKNRSCGTTYVAAIQEIDNQLTIYKETLMDIEQQIVDELEKTSTMMNPIFERKCNTNTGNTIATCDLFNKITLDNQVYEYGRSKDFDNVKNIKEEIQNNLSKELKLNTYNNYSFIFDLDEDKKTAKKIKNIYNIQSQKEEQDFITKYKKENTYNTEAIIISDNNKDIIGATAYLNEDNDQKCTAKIIRSDGTIEEFQGTPKNIAFMYDSKPYGFCGLKIDYITGCQNDDHDKEQIVGIINGKKLIHKEISHQDYDNDNEICTKGDFRTFSSENFDSKNFAKSKLMSYEQYTR